MADLTPEERERIYLEEKARLEARRELESRKIGAGKVIGYFVLAIVGLLVMLFVFGIATEESREQSETATYNKLTPDEKNAQIEKNCTAFLASIYYKTYSELSVEERQKKAVCEMELDLLRQLKKTEPSKR